MISTDNSRRMISAVSDLVGTTRVGVFLDVPQWSLLRRSAIATNHSFSMKTHWEIFAQPTTAPLHDRLTHYSHFTALWESRVSQWAMSTVSQCDEFEYFDGECGTSVHTLEFRSHNSHHQLPLK